MQIRILIITILAVALLGLPLAVSSHPHNWIDIKVEVQFDNNGQATGLYQTWLFDDYYSMTVTEGMDEDGDGTPDESRLNGLRKLIFGNLKAYNFFTHVESNGKNVACGPVSQGGIKMQQNRLEMRFYIPFNVPHNLRDAMLTYRIFDPSYYIEILHAEDKDAIVLRDPPAGCRYNLKPPHPDPKKIAYAASLPAGKSGGELGQFFTEKATISCQTNP